MPRRRVEGFEVAAAIEEEFASDPNNVPLVQQLGRLQRRYGFEDLVYKNGDRSPEEESIVRLHAVVTGLVPRAGEEQISQLAQAGLRSYYALRDQGNGRG